MVRQKEKAWIVYYGLLFFSFFLFYPFCFVKGKTVTLKLKNVNFEVKTRAQTLPYAVATVEDVFAVAKDLLKMEIENESPQPLRLRLMGNYI